MAKKKKSKNVPYENYNVTKSADEDALSKAFVKAYFEIESEKEAKVKRLAEAERRELMKSFGQKELSENENSIKRFFHKIGNDIRLIVKLLFIKREEVKNTRATFALMSLTLSAIFTIVKWLLYFLSFGLFLGVVLRKINALWLVVTLLVWLVARIFRIAVFEIDEMRDDALLTSIFSGVLAFVAAVAAIIALFK